MMTGGRQAITNRDDIQREIDLEIDRAIPSNGETGAGATPRPGPLPLSSLLRVPLRSKILRGSRGSPGTSPCIWPKTRADRRQLPRQAGKASCNGVADRHLRGGISARRQARRSLMGHRLEERHGSLSVIIERPADPGTSGSGLIRPDGQHASDSSAHLTDDKAQARGHLGPHVHGPGPRLPPTLLWVTPRHLSPCPDI